jgi:hypothetical protein
MDSQPCFESRAVVEIQMEIGSVGEIADGLLHCIATTLECNVGRDNENVQWSGKFRPALTGQGVYPRPVQNPFPGHAIHS